MLDGSYPVRDWASNVVSSGSSNNLPLTVDNIVSANVATGANTRDVRQPPGAQVQHRRRRSGQNDTLIA